ncbi:preprotein translocase subunit SecE [Sphingomonas koreensis]|nr:preprotein translocase subunit SecE [Sphingomonas koreensis]TPG42441.1 preprotein translocase subunit SecE [Sphingomonas koreensis]
MTKRRPARAGQRTHARFHDFFEDSPVARTSPIEFIREVQAETRKVVWPSRKQTIMTGVMVMIMTSLLAVFFVSVDSVFEALVHFLLSLAA